MVPFMAPTLEGLDRRVAALERAQEDTTETLKWVVARLGRIQAVQDEHTLRLERLEHKVDALDGRLGNVEARLGSLERKLDDLMSSLPGLIADALQSVS